MPTPQWDSAAVVVGDRIYVIGGMNSALTPFATVDVYDPATDTWAEGPPMPTPRSTPGVCAVGNQIYVVGGARAWAWDIVGAVEVLDTGLPVPPQSVRPAGKLSTTWGEVKRGR